MWRWEVLFRLSVKLNLFCIFSRQNWTFFFSLCKLGTSPVCWVQNFMYCSYIFSYVLFWGHKYCLSKKSHFLVTKKIKIGHAVLILVNTYINGKALKEKILEMKKVLFSSSRTALTIARRKWTQSCRSIASHTNRNRA